MVLMDINFTYPLPTIEVPDSLQISDNCVVEPEDPPAAKRPKKTRVSVTNFINVGGQP